MVTDLASTLVLREGLGLWNCVAILASGDCSSLQVLGTASHRGPMLQERCPREQVDALERLSDRVQAVVPLRNLLA